MHRGVLAILIKIFASFPRRKLRGAKQYGPTHTLGMPSIEIAKMMLAIILPFTIISKEEARVVILWVWQDVFSSIDMVQILKIKQMQFGPNFQD